VLESGLFVLESALFVLESALFVLESALFVLESALFVLESALFASESALFASESALFVSESALFALESALFALDGRLFVRFALSKRGVACISAVVEVAGEIFANSSPGVPSKPAPGSALSPRAGFTNSQERSDERIFPVMIPLVRSSSGPEAVRQPSTHTEQRKGRR
jgi:hypothetical protein